MTWILVLGRDDQSHRALEGFPLIRTRNLHDWTRKSPEFTAWIYSELCPLCAGVVDGLGGEGRVAVGVIQQIFSFSLQLQSHHRQQGLRNVHGKGNNQQVPSFSHSQPFGSAELSGHHAGRW